MCIRHELVECDHEVQRLTCINRREWRKDRWESFGTPFLVPCAEGTSWGAVVAIIHARLESFIGRADFNVRVNLSRKTFNCFDAIGGGRGERDERKWETRDGSEVVLNKHQVAIKAVPMAGDAKPREIEMGDVCAISPEEAIGIFWSEQDAPSAVFSPDVCCCGRRGVAEVLLLLLLLLSATLSSL